MNISQKFKNKKIGLDLLFLDPNYYGGVDTYANGLINGIRKIKNVNFTIFINIKYYFKRKIKKSKNIKFCFFELSLPKKILFKIYNKVFPLIAVIMSKKKFYFDFKIRNYIFEEFKKKIENNCNYLISPLVNLTCYNAKVIKSTNLHDIQQVHFPKFFTFMELSRRSYTYFNTMKYSNQIIASSKFIKKDLISNFKNLNKNIKIIDEGTDIKKINKKIKIIYKKYFFFPAQMWPHKNFIITINGFEKFNKINNYKYSLLICGKKFDKEKKILELISKTKQCYHMGIINRDLLENFYVNSIAVICPGLYESSCLPMLEAFNFKTNVIASDIEPNLEKKKKFKFFIFKRNNSNHLSEVFMKVANLKNKKKIIDYNFQKLKKYDWKIIAQNWLKAL